MGGEAHRVKFCGDKVPRLVRSYRQMPRVSVMLAEPFCAELTEGSPVDLQSCSLPGFRYYSSHTSSHPSRSASIKRGTSRGLKNTWTCPSHVPLDHFLSSLRPFGRGLDTLHLFDLITVRHPMTNWMKCARFDTGLASLLQVARVSRCIYAWLLATWCPSGGSTSVLGLCRICFGGRSSFTSKDLKKRPMSEKECGPQPPRLWPSGLQRHSMLCMGAEV